MRATLVVGLDGTQHAERVFPYVEVFAKALDADVVLIRAVPPREPFEAEHYLDGVAKRLGARGIRAIGAVCEGDPARVLVEEAQARGATMILMTTRGRSGLWSTNLHSVTEAVVRHSPVPVLVTRALAPNHGVMSPTDQPRIFVSLDGTAAAERALPIATELARALSAEIHLVEVIPASRDSPKKIQKQEETSATNYLSTIGGRLRDAGLKVTTMVRIDSTGAGIVVSAAASGALLIVVATQVPHGIERAPIPCICTEVLHRGTLPVLLVGPGVTSDSLATV